MTPKFLESSRTSALRFVARSAQLCAASQLTYSLLFLEKVGVERMTLMTSVGANEASQYSSITGTVGLASPPYSHTSALYIIICAHFYMLFRLPALEKFESRLL